MGSSTSDFEPGTDGPSLIMAGVDGSRTSLRAVAYAAGLARRQGCGLLVVYVSKVPATAGMSPATTALMSETTDQIGDELRQSTLSQGAEKGVPIEFRSVHGDPLAELVKIAAETRADAVVVGSSEHLGHRIVGSLASRLIHTGKWPVIVVP